MISSRYGGPVLALALLTGRAQAADGGAAAPVAASKRSADAILDDFARAVASAAGAGRHHSLHMKVKVQVPKMNLTGSEERWLTSAGRFLSVVTMPGLGTIRQGSDGHLFWSEDPINGLRKLEGAEEDQARIEATWNAELKLKRLYKSATVVAPPADAPRDAPLECVRLTPSAGTPVVTCFDGKTHLRRFQQGTESTAQGDVPYTHRESDWRDVEGMKFPFRSEMVAGPATLEQTIETVEFDKKEAADLFRTPEAVKGAKAATKNEKAAGGSTTP